MKKFDNSVLITLIIVVGVIILFLISWSIFNSFVPKNTVNSNGMSSIKVMPDLVTVYINIETRGKTSEEANNKNSEIFDKLMDSLSKDGLSNKEIQTHGFNIYPNYNWENGKNEIKDYTAIHSLVTKISAQETSKIGKVIDSSVEAGATVNSVNFELSLERQNQYKAEAIKLAGRDAQIKVQALAEGVGKRVGELISISSSDFYYMPWKIYESSSSSVDLKVATTNIQPSEQEITASVTAIFEIK